jgi:hypothetical protein
MHVAVIARRIVLILESLYATQTRVPLLAVPRYCTLVASNNTSALSSSSGPMTAPGMMAAMTEPSLGAIVARKPAARPLAAPGMFLGTMLGLPGMRRP